MRRVLWGEKSTAKIARVRRERAGSEPQSPGRLSVAVSKAEDVEKGMGGQRVARVRTRRRKSAPDLGQTSERSNSQSVLAGEVAISAWIAKCIGVSGKSAESKLLNRRETAAGVIPNEAVDGLMWDRRIGRFLERTISRRKT